MTKTRMEICPVTGDRCSCTGHCNIEALQRRERQARTTIDVSPERLRENADNLSPSGNYWVCDVLKAAADEIARLRTALAFARSVIKSGEPWTETCERELKL